MGIKVQRQDNLDKLFEKFAVGPDEKANLDNNTVQKTIDEHARLKKAKEANDKQSKTKH